MNIRITRGVERINDNENKWKIQRNQTKFKVLPLAQFKTEPLITNNDLINRQKEGVILGLKLTTNGFNAHICEGLTKAIYL